MSTSQSERSPELSPPPTQSPESARGTPCQNLKNQLCRWKILGGVFATLLVIGWVFIIVILIQEEKWQLVLVAWLLLYAAAHFCYWYFKRHHLLSIQSHICGRSRAVGPLRRDEKVVDSPPTYDDIIKSEVPPPEYYSVVIERPKISPSKPSTPSRLSKFALQSIPRVFGRSPSASSLSSPSCSNQSSTHSSFSSKKAGGPYKFKEVPSSSQQSIAPSISAALPILPKYASNRGPPPQYEESEADARSQLANVSSSPQSRRFSVISNKQSHNLQTSHPIFNPIHNKDANRVRPHSPLDPRRSRSSAAPHTARKRPEIDD